MTTAFTAQLQMPLVGLCLFNGRLHYCVICNNTLDRLSLYFDTLSFCCFFLIQFDANRTIDEIYKDVKAFLSSLTGKLSLLVKAKRYSKDGGPGVV